MKKPYPIIILTALLIIGSFSNFVLAGHFKKHIQNTSVQTRRQSQQKSTVHQLTFQDRKKYLLKIDQQKIGWSHDTFYYRRKCKFFNVPVILSNLSNDTVRYLTMSCSWYDFFSINNKKLTISGWPCDSNFPKEKLHLPHKSVTYNIPVILMNGYVEADKFSVGMNLFIVDKENRDFILDIDISRHRTSNLIWSNEVKIP